MSGAWARLTAWRRQHPRLAGASLVALVALLAWAGYQGLTSYRARSHLDAARRAAQRHEWSEVREHAQASLRYRPGQAAVHLLAARAARRLEFLDEADEHLEEAQRLLGDENQAVKVERALLRVYRDDLASVEGFLRRCVADDDPDAVEILDVLSAVLILHYRVAEARYCLDDLLRRQPDHFHALVRRAWTARSAGSDFFVQAIEYFEKALALRPDADTVRLALAEMQVAVGRFADARKNFEELRRRQPAHPSILFGLARSLAGLGQLDEARRLLDRVLAANRNDWKALGERGGLAMQQRRLADAEADLREAVRLAPPDLPLLSRFARCLTLVGKKDEARDYQARADQLRADFAQADRLGTVIREQCPDDPQPRYDLACILLRIGKTDDALHWFRTALEKSGDRHRPTHEALAEFYAKVGDFAKAAHHRQRMRELDGPR